MTEKYKNILANIGLVAAAIAVILILLPHDDRQSYNYELNQLTHKGYEYADKNYFAHDRKLHNTIMRNNFFSALPRYAKRIYGV